MTDFYTQRLQELQGKKEASLAKKLPLQRPLNSINSGTGQDLRKMAGNPQQPTQEQTPQINNSFFKTMFDKYSEDEGFKSGMEEFSAVMKTMREELNGIELPPEMLEKRVRNVVDKYKQKTMYGQQMQQQAALQNIQGAMSMMEGNPNVNN